MIIRYEAYFIGWLNFNNGSRNEEICQWQGLVIWSLVDWLASASELTVLGV